MASEPENIGLSILRDRRADVSDIKSGLPRPDETLHDGRRLVASLDRRVEPLDHKFDMIREGTVSASGYAVTAGRAHVGLHPQIAELTRRVEELEAAK